MKGVSCMIYNILDYLERAEKKHPDKILFADPEHQVTYKECVRIGKSIGTAIAKEGAPRRPAAVLIDREIESTEIFMGSVYAGNFYVPIGKALPVGRISMILDTVRPACFVCREKDLPFVEKLGYEGKVLVYEQILHTPADKGCWCATGQ